MKDDEVLVLWSKEDEDKFFTENRLAFGKCKENGRGTHVTVFRKVRYYEDGLPGYICVRQCVWCGKTFDGKHRVFVLSNLDRKGYYVEPVDVVKKRK